MSRRRFWGVAGAVALVLVISAAYAGKGGPQERPWALHPPGPEEILEHPFWVQLPNLPVKVPAMYAGGEPRKPWPEALKDADLGGSTPFYPLAVFCGSDPSTISTGLGDEERELLRALQGKSTLVTPGGAWFPIDSPAYDYGRIDQGSYDEEEGLWRWSLLLYKDGELKKELPLVSPNFDIYTYSGTFYLQKGRKERYFKNPDIWVVMIVTPIYYSYPSGRLPAAEKAQ